MNTPPTPNTDTIASNVPDASPTDTESNKSFQLTEKGTTHDLATPVQISNRHKLFLASFNRKTYIELYDHPNPHAIALSSVQADSLIHEEAHQRKKSLSRKAVSDAKYFLQSIAERNGTCKDIWYRVAPIAGGVEFDLGGPGHARVRITAGQVKLIKKGSDVLFYRTSAMMPMAKPVDIGDIDLLKKYVNLHPVPYTLFVAWLTYTLATPKSRTAKFLILVLHGGEGCGKSALAKLAIRIVDPSQVGVQTLHNSAKDLAIASQSAHLVAYDNLRWISHAMADLLCIASTGGNISTRQLYTNEDQCLLRLHGALILNGIPSVVDQPDLAQRCLILHMERLPESLRRSDAEMSNDLDVDLPAIQRGLFDLIAKIFEQLPNAVVTRPARMIDFSRWLAAMELVHGAPEGAYQDVYLETLKQGQLDSVLDNVLSAEVLKFCESHMEGSTWSGTPSELLQVLNASADLGSQNSKGWPGNAIALSKRLLPLQTALSSQGILIDMHRGKQRTITIILADGFEKQPPSIDSDGVV